MATEHIIDGRNKYRTITLAVGVFLVLLITVLSINFYFSNQLSRLTVQIDAGVNSVTTLMT